MRVFITKFSRFSFLKVRRGSCINKENPPRGEGKQFQLHKLSSSSYSSLPFVDLIIGEVTNPPSSDRPFVGSRCVADTSRVRRSR